MKPKKLVGLRGASDDVRVRRTEQRGEVPVFPLVKVKDGFSIQFDPAGALGVDPVRGVIVRTGSGLSVAQGSPYRLVVELAEGLEFDSLGKIAPRVSPSLRVDAKGRLIARPSAAEVSATGGDASVQAYLDRLQSEKVAVDAIPLQTALQTTFVSAGGLAATTVQDALEELDSKKAAADHSHVVALVVCFHALSSAQATWANMPEAATLLNGHHRHVARADLTGYEQVRLHVNKMGTAGVAGSKLILRYGTTFATTAGGYSDAGTSEVSCAIDATDTYVSSSWVDLAEGAMADVFLAIVGSGGDGSTDPQYGSIHAEFR